MSQSIDNPQDPFHACLAFIRPIAAETVQRERPPSGGRAASYNTVMLDNSIIQIGKSLNDHSAEVDRCIAVVSHFSRTICKGGRQYLRRGHEFPQVDRSEPDAERAPITVGIEPFFVELLEICNDSQSPGPFLFP